MSEKGLIKIVVLCGLIFLVVLIGKYFIREKKQLSEVPAMNAVPVNSPLIIESKQIKKLLSCILYENKMLNELTKLFQMKQLKNDASFIDSLMISNTKFKNLISDKSLIISTHIIGKNKIEFIHVLNLENERNTETANKFLQSIIPKTAKVAHRTYNECTINRVKTASIDFTYTFASGFFIYSHSELLVEDAVRQLDSDKTIDSDRGFKKVAQTAGQNVCANIYLNYKMLPKLVSLSTNKNLENAVTVLRDLAQWTELDVNIKKDELLLNGWTCTGDSSAAYLNVLNEQSPVEFETTEILPDNTSNFILIGIDDKERFKNSYMKFLTAQGISDEYKQELNQIKTEYQTDVESMFYSFLDDEIGVVYADINRGGAGQHIYSILKVRSRGLAREQLLKFIKHVATKNNIDVNNYISKSSIDQDKQIIIYRLPYRNIIKTLFGRFFANCSSSYYTLYDNYLIFGDSQEALTDFVYNNELNRTLNNDPEYRGFFGSLAHESNFFYYSNMSRTVNLLPSFLNTGMMRKVDKNIYSFRRFQALAVQLIPDDDLTYTNIFLKYNPAVKSNNPTLWESRLDTAFNFKPFLFTNHYTFEKEIFVQDLSNKIYLMNRSGRILWKRRLSEKIISDIYEFDYYKNRKFQLLFNTRSEIHLVDRNKNYVKGYPIKLPARATAGLTLLDFHENKNYTIYVPCEDLSVYAYNKDATPVRGWNPQKTEFPVYSPVQYFSSGGIDYLVYADKLNVYIVNRKGKRAIKVKERFTKSPNNRFHIGYYAGKKKAGTCLVTTSANGTVMFIYMDGTVDKLSLKECTIKHYFDYVDLDADGQSDFLFIDNARMEAYRYDKQLLFSHAFENDIKNAPIVFNFPRYKKKIGVTNQAKQKIFLFNADGSTDNEFPLSGRTLFSIGYMVAKSPDFNLIVGNEENFIVSYQIDNK